MKPLLVLLLVFAVCFGITKLFYGKMNVRFPAIISICVMFVFTALAHFKYTEGMSMMLPDFIPLKKEIVYATGLLEIILAIGLLFKRIRRFSALLLIWFLILVLPANIYAAIHEVNFEDVSNNGHGTGYLWFRIPLQLFFIAWIYFTAVFTGSKKGGIAVYGKIKK
jgi:uncharacterized membrane protein